MMGDDLQPTQDQDGLDEDGLLTTDQMAAIAKATKEESAVEPTRWQRLWTRIGHVYHTKMRTTTVLLIVAFLASVTLYGFTTSFYGVAPPTVNEQQRRQLEERRTTETTPETSVSRTPESRTSEPSTEPSTTSPTPTRSGPLDFLFPQNDEASPTQEPDTTAPTTSVPAR